MQESKMIVVVLAFITREFAPNLKQEENFYFLNSKKFDPWKKMKRQNFKTVSFFCYESKKKLINN